MAKKKRHHYIPRFYLDGFVDPHNKPYIWVYEKGSPNIIKATARNIAIQKNYYSVATSEGEKDSEVFENALAELEGRAAPIFQKIRNHESLNGQERSLFSIFLAFTMTRVPSHRENIEKATGEFMKKMSIILASNPAGFKSMIEKFERDRGNKIGMSVEELRKFMLEGQYDITTDPQFSLGMIPMMAKSLIPIFYKMDWAFLEATDDYKFVTSDNPLSYFDPTHDPRSFYGVGLLSRNIEVTFPISKDLLFFGTWGKFKGYKKLNNKLVKEMNGRTVISALRFVFAPQYSDGLNRFVQKYKDSSPRIKVDSIGDYIIAH